MSPLFRNPLIRSVLDKFASLTFYILLFFSWIRIQKVCKSWVKCDRFEYLLLAIAFEIRPLAASYPKTVNKVDKNALEMKLKLKEREPFLKIFKICIGRWNYSALGSRQVPIYRLGSYILLLLPSWFLPALKLMRNCIVKHPPNLKYSPFILYQAVYLKKLAFQLI